MRTNAPVRKRPVNLTINAVLLEQARAYTSNLSESMEILLADFVAEQQQAGRSRQRSADRCAQDWNKLHDDFGPFADAHSTL